MSDTSKAKAVLDPARRVSLDELAARLGIHRRTLNRRIAAGMVPPPVRLSPRRVYWPLDEIVQFVVDQKLPH